MNGEVMLMRTETHKKLAVVGLMLAAIVFTHAGRAADMGCYWVYFRDKGIAPGEMQQALAQTRATFLPRNLARREKSMPQIVDEKDLRVCPEYVSQIAEAGVQIRTVSRWLNAVSIETTTQQAEFLKTLGCVSRVEPFASRRGLRDIAPKEMRNEILDDPNYGPSYQQNAMCRVPELHSRGLSGQGVLICFLDTGFRLNHRVFDSLNVVATYDFIFGDTIVSNQHGQDSSGQDSHGTGVLSAAVGYRDGVLIGPAFGADVLCAKTEWVADETPVEEDYYVAALEWADSLGADITSSSLGYLDWYDFSDLNGHTAVTTIGVNVAVSRGILVVTAAGNERQSDWGHIIAPADADSILASGAVDTSRIIADFSSPGPTADGRIKPDVCAQGVDVLAALAGTSDSYAYWGGTSLSTPLVAGIAALIMEAHPDWTAQQVRTAMLNTASQADSPDNDYGHGIVDAVQAADYVFGSITPLNGVIATNAVLLSSYPNPFNGSALLTLTLMRASKGELRLYDVLGREIRNWEQLRWQQGENHILLNPDGLSTGTYYAQFIGTAGSTSLRIIVLK